MRPRFSLPAQNVPLLLADGTMNPDWYEKLKIIETFVNLFGFIDFQRPAAAPGVLPTTGPILNNQVCIWDAAQGVFKAGAN